MKPLACVLRGTKAALARGDCVANTLWDIEKFVDTVNVPITIREAEKLAYPPSVLLVGMPQHAGPRCISRRKRSVRAKGETLRPTAIRGATISPQ